MQKFSYSLLLIFIFLSCSRSPRVTVAGLSASQQYKTHFSKLPTVYAREMQEKIRSFWYERLAVPEFSGMVLVAKNNQILFEHYGGWANRATDMRVSSTTPLHVASVSKTVTSIVILRLVEQRKLKLRDKVTQHLHEFPWDDVTVQDLLTHRSGVPYYGYFADSIWPTKEKLTNEDVLTALSKNIYPQNFPANTHFAYCNTNYALLALIAERIEGKKFPQIVSELVFGPLKMDHSFILTEGMQTESISQSYKRNRAQEFGKLDFIYGDKNLYTTVRDLFRLNQALYSDDFLSAAMKKQMFRGYSYEKPGKANYGLGVRIREFPGKENLVFHTGWWHGNTSCFAMMRPDSACAIIISNNYNRKIYAINRISLLFGNYPYEENVDALGGFFNERETQKLKE